MHKKIKISGQILTNQQTESGKNLVKLSDCTIIKCRKGATRNGAPLCVYHEKSDKSYSNRPWADIMYQLNIDFNDNPADDIVDIKEKLNFLLNGIEDEELEKEINDLENYVEKLYLDHDRISSGFNRSETLTSQLDNFSIINRATLF